MCMIHDICSRYVSRFRRTMHASEMEIDIRDYLLDLLLDGVVIARSGRPHRFKLFHSVCFSTKSQCVCVCKIS